MGYLTKREKSYFKSYPNGTVKLSRILPQNGRILLNLTVPTWAWCQRTQQDENRAERCQECPFSLSKDRRAAGTDPVAL